MLVDVLRKYIRRQTDLTAYSPGVKLQEKVFHSFPYCQSYSAAHKVSIVGLSIVQTIFTFIWSSVGLTN